MSKYLRETENTNNYSREQQNVPALLGLVVASVNFHTDSIRCVSLKDYEPQ